MSDIKLYDLISLLFDFVFVLPIYFVLFIKKYHSFKSFIYRDIYRSIFKSNAFFIVFKKRLKILIY